MNFQTVGVCLTCIRDFMVRLFAEFYTLWKEYKEFSLCQHFITIAYHI